MKPCWNLGNYRAMGEEGRQHNPGYKKLRKESIRKLWKRTYPGLQLPKTDLIQEFVGSHSKKPASWKPICYTHNVYCHTYREHTKITLLY